MAFTLPIFNLTANIWHSPHPITDPPDLTPMVQKYLNSRGLLDIEEDDDALWVPPIWIRLPFGIDVRRLDKIECPAGSGNLYHVRWHENVHEGFPNQYTVAVCHQLASTPPSGGVVLMEDGTDVLMEDGTQVLME